MLVGCPRCKTRFRIDDEKIGENGVKLRCSKCSALFRVMKKPLSAQADECGSPVVPPASPPGRITLVVANESSSFCTAVQKVLAMEPIDVIACNDGDSAIAAIVKNRPQVLLTDVALQGSYGFDLCARIKNDQDLAAVKIILIASIYDKTRYKREPVNLYGADDYIEKHNIPNELAVKINRLVAGQPPAGEETPAEPKVGEDTDTAVPTNSGDELPVAADGVQVSAVEVPPPSAQPATAEEMPAEYVKAKRLARLIVSDIALYNQARVEEGARNGTLFELLAQEIGEGKRHYCTRVSEEVRAKTSFLDDAFSDLIAAKRKELNL